MSRSPNSRETRQSNGFTPHGSYLPPFRQVLRVLGVSNLDPNAKEVKVSTSGLLYILSGLLSRVDVDEEWYTSKYPDVHAAILSGDTPSGAVHFRVTGYREGRLPCRLPFDHKYYFEQYKDLAAVFSANDEEALENHYQTTGYEEGRTGIREHFREAEDWLAAAKQE